MLDHVRNAMQNGIPVNIYFEIAVNGKPKNCLLYYAAFIVIEINEKKKTFSEYTIQERNKSSELKILTEDTYLPICRVENFLL